MIFTFRSGINEHAESLTSNTILHFTFSNSSDKKIVMYGLIQIKIMMMINDNEKNPNNNQT